MKKQLINEAFRLQTLAGIRPINSLNEEEENKELSPEQAVQKAMTYVSKLENSPEIDKLAQKIAKDPALIAQLEKSLTKGGIQTDLNEVENELDTNDMKTLMVKFAEKAEDLKEGISNNPDADDTSAGLAMLSFFGGGAIAGSFSSAIAAAVPAAATLFAGPAFLGALAGLGLFLIARKVYLMNNPDV